MLAHHKSVAVGKSHHRPFGQAHLVDKSAVGATGVTQQHLRTGSHTAHGNYHLASAHVMLRIVKQNLGTWRSGAATHSIVAGQEIMALAGVNIFERNNGLVLLVQTHSSLSRRLL